MKANKHFGDNMKDDTRLALLEQSIGHINETMLRIEKRFDSLENDVRQGFNRLDIKIDSNFKWLLTLGISSFSAMFGMLAHAMHWF